MSNISSSSSSLPVVDFVRNRPWTSVLVGGVAAIATCTYLYVSRDGLAQRSRRYLRQMMTTVTPEHPRDATQPGAEAAIVLEHTAQRTVHEILATARTAAQRSMTPVGPVSLGHNLLLRECVPDDLKSLRDMFLEIQNEYGPNEKYIDYCLETDMSDVNVNYLQAAGSNFWLIVDSTSPSRLLGGVGFHPTSIGDANYHKTLTYPTPTAEQLKKQGPFAGQECELRRMMVRPEARKKGAAIRLLDRFVAFARSQGYEAIHLTTLEHMLPACRLYEKYGFKLSKQERVNYPAHGREYIIVQHYRYPLQSA